eukprot:scaffold14782_cov174-Amphora_coffeaeformis.AAC.12
MDEPSLGAFWRKAGRMYHDLVWYGTKPYTATKFQGRLNKGTSSQSLYRWSTAGSHPPINFFCDIVLSVCFCEVVCIRIVVGGGARLFLGMM